MDYFNDYGIACYYGKIYNISKYKNIFYEFVCYKFLQDNKRHISKYFLRSHANNYNNRYISTYSITCNRSDRLLFFLPYGDNRCHLTIYKTRK